MNKVLIALSFIFMTCCTTFLSENENAMSFTVTLPQGDVQLSGNPVNVVATTTTTGVTNHYILCRIASVDGVIPFGPWVLEAPVVNGSATIDIHAVVDAEFDYDFSKDFSATAEKVYEHFKLAANFRIQIGERYVDSNGARFETDFTNPEADMATTNVKILKGGLSNVEFSRIVESSSAIICNGFLRKKDNFQKNLPATSWLKLWFSPTTSENYTITVTGYYADSTTLTQSHTFAANNGKMYEINTNLAVWTDIKSTNSGSPLRGFTVSLSNAYSIQDLYGIMIDTVFHESVNEFYFLGAMGNIDLNVFTGTLTEIYETIGEIYTRNLPVTPTVMDRTLIAERKIIGRRFKCNTGVLTLEERRALAEFLSSPLVWWKTGRYKVSVGEADIFVPVVVLPGTYDIDTTGVDLVDVDFEFKIAHIDKF